MIVVACAVSLFFNPHLRICLLIFREKDRERNLNWLPPTCTPTGDQTCNLLVYGTTLQPTEPPGQGCVVSLVVLMFPGRKAEVSTKEEARGTEKCRVLEITGHQATAGACLSKAAARPLTLNSGTHWRLQRLLQEAPRECPPHAGHRAGAEKCGEWDWAARTEPAIR